MRLGGILLLIYLLAAALVLVAFRAGLPPRYTASRSFAVNHRLAKGDFTPDPDLDHGPLYLAATVRGGQKIATDSLLPSPDPQPIKGTVLVGLADAALPKGSDAGDMLSLCGKDGGEVAAIQLSAIDCSGAGAQTACGTLIQARPEVAAKMLAAVPASGVFTFSAVGSCKPAVTPAPPEHVE